MWKPIKLLVKHFGVTTANVGVSNVKLFRWAIKSQYLDVIEYIVCKFEITDHTIRDEQDFISRKCHRNTSIMAWLNKILNK